MTTFTDALFLVIVGVALGYLIRDWLAYHRRKRARVEMDLMIQRVVTLPHDIQTVDPPPLATLTETELRNRVHRRSDGADDGRC